MGHGPVFSETRTRQADDTSPGLPIVSESLNAIRAYSWECHFKLPDIEGVPAAASRDLVLAAKQVSEAGFAVGDIEVNRINDKVFYPGRPEQDELTITFDNLYAGTPGITLWKWFKSIYDPMTGEFTEGMPGGVGNFKAETVEIFQLDPQTKPVSSTKYFGVYPKSWKGAEYNYGTNEFHTVSVVFRYDFMDHGVHGNSRGA